MNAKKPITMPRYTPPILDSMQTTVDDQTTGKSSMSAGIEKSLERLQSQIQDDQRKINQNQSDLIKLQRLAANSENSTFNYSSLTNSALGKV